MNPSAAQCLNVRGVRPCDAMSVGVERLKGALAALRAVANTLETKDTLTPEDVAEMNRRLRETHDAKRALYGSQ